MLEPKVNQTGQRRKATDSPETQTAHNPSPTPSTPKGSSTPQDNASSESQDMRHTFSPAPSRRDHRTTPHLSEDTFHSLWFDRDDQIVCSGPSSGLPMLERLGALHWMTVRGNEAPLLSTADTVAQPRILASHAETHRKLLSDACPRSWMNMLIRHHFSSTAVMWPILHKPSFLKVSASLNSPPQVVFCVRSHPQS
jgi:hypothetical protein